MFISKNNITYYDNFSSNTNTERVVLVLILIDLKLSFFSFYWLDFQELLPKARDKQNH